MFWPPLNDYPLPFRPAPLWKVKYHPPAAPAPKPEPLTAEAITKALAALPESTLAALSRALAGET